ncbi:hypothetical protein PP713_13945 [Mycobacterium sp. CSUR Q5927]|nr:hypothetical protein [Mycobacterium sp. CSUR Q5927]
MTWLVLRYWYGYHRSKFQKWREREGHIKRRQATKILRQRRVLKVARKREYHGFWLDHYCELLSAYGHGIECIHFSPGENTIQSGECPNARKRP